MEAVLVVGLVKWRMSRVDPVVPGILWNLGAVQIDGRRGNELPVFRKRIEDWLPHYKAPGGHKAPNFVGDPAFGDKELWTRMAITGERARFITRTKANLKPIVYSAYRWDATDPVNDGVEADEMVGFDGNMTKPRIWYRDPEKGIQYEFLTSVENLGAGLTGMLNLVRWRIEKIFDTTKNKLEETKGGQWGRRPRRSGHNSWP